MGKIKGNIKALNVKKLIKIDSNSLYYNKKIILIVLLFAIIIILLIYLYNYSLKQTKIKEEFKLFRKIKKGFQKAGKAIVDTGKKAVEETKQFAEKAAGETKQFAEKAAGETKEFAEKAAQETKEFAEKTAQEALEVFKINEAIREFKTGIKNTYSVFEYIDNMVNDIGGSIMSYNNSLKQIPNTFNRLSDFNL
jgi:methyl-accepting chemotaxis protein